MPNDCKVLASGAALRSLSILPGWITGGDGASVIKLLKASDEVD